MRTISIAGRTIGRDHSCFIVAEAGVNHNGELHLATRLVEAAAEAGANAVKFQTFVAENIVTPRCRKATYQLRNSPASESQLEMLRRLQLSPAAHRELQAVCRSLGIVFMSSPFDESSADFLSGLPVEVFKIPSGEITNVPLLAHVAQKRKPIILSTGMSTLGEVETAVQTIRDTGQFELVLLHCVSSYPADPTEVNLRAMQTMASTFQVPVGFSDHTKGIAVALAAVALGACVIEKHLTLDRTLPGPDHQASLVPDEFAELVQGIRTVEAALGHGRKEPSPAEVDTASVVRKSLVAARDIPAGSTLTAEMVAVKRPGTGLPPSMRAQLIGRLAKQEIEAGTLLTFDILI